MKRYFVPILIAVCLAPIMYSKGWYLHSCSPASQVVAQAKS